MYEDYMQNLLGIQMNPYQDTYEYLSRNTAMMDNSVDLEECYPEIYRIIYPMVRSACMRNTRTVTRELIDEMTQDIYSNIETGDIINLNINIDNSENRDTSEVKKDDKVRQVENRQFNRPLNDLIRILLIRELLGRPNFGRPNPPRTMPPRPNPPRPIQPRAPFMF